MTGYGRGSASRREARAVVEVRSVNHRYLDLKLRGSTLEPALEEQVTRRVRARIERGAVTVMVKLEAGGAAAGVTVDRAAAIRVHRDLRALARTLRLDPDTVGLDLVCAQPGVLITPDEVVSEEAAACAVDALDAALTGLVGMREAEGSRIGADVRDRLERLAGLVESTREISQALPDNAASRLRDRLARLLETTGVAVDEARLAQEVAVLADRVDVTEELVRMRSHIEQMGKAMQRTGAIGRRMEFLIQEMGRELNTIGAKSQSADITRGMVEAKAELEKIREQVQNIQ